MHGGHAVDLGAVGELLDAAPATLGADSELLGMDRAEPLFDQLGHVYAVGRRRPQPASATVDPQGPCPARASEPDRGLPVVAYDQGTYSVTN